METVKTELPELINSKDFGLEKEKTVKIVESFMPKIVERDGLVEVYKNILTKEITRELVHEAYDLRKKLVKIRTGISAVHKTEKAYYLASGNYCDALKNKLTLPVEQMEEKLIEIEKHFENIEAERLGLIHIERVEKLKPFGYEIGATDFSLMDENMFNAILVGAEKTHTDKVEVERKAEEKRIEDARIEAEEKEKQRLELERLRLENESKEKQLEAERIESAKKEQEAKAKADADLAEANRLAKIESYKQAKILADQKAANDKLQAELKAKADADAKILEDKKQQDLILEKQKQKELKAPDKDKLTVVAMQLTEFKSLLPEMKTADAKKISENIKVLIDKVIIYTKEQSEKL